MSILLAALLLQPINVDCPVKPGQKSRAANLVVYKGRPIGLCWQSCIGKFNADPEKFAALISEFKAPVGPRNLQALEAAAPAALAAKKPLALLFVLDDEPRSYTLLRILSDPGVGDALDKVVWARIPWTKDGAEAKAHKIGAPGAIVLLDPTVDPPKPIKTLRALAPASMRKELLDASKLVK